MVVVLGGRVDVRHIPTFSSYHMICPICSSFAIAVPVLYPHHTTTLTDSPTCSRVVFPEGADASNAVVHLLYRPGHYDILYPLTDVPLDTDVAIKSIIPITGSA